MSDGQGTKATSKMTIPVGEMAKQSIGKIYPQLTAEQIEALNTGKPIPPSPDYRGGPLGVVVARESDADLGRIEELNKKIGEQAQLLREKVRIEGIFDACVEASKGGPTVTAILVFGDKNRLRRARKAVNQFVAQSYPNKQIVIINATDISVTTHPHRLVKEIKWEPGLPATTRHMRTEAIGAADGDLLFPFWDDDDVYDRHLLTYLVSNYQAGKAVLLNSQIRVDIKNSVAYVHVEPDGIPNTILCPKADRKFFGSNTGPGEDYEFWNSHWGVKSVVVDNRAFPANTMLMRVWDGNNVLPVEDFMKPPGLDKEPYERMEGRWVLGGNEAEHVKAVFESFGLRAEAKAPTEQPAGV